MINYKKLSIHLGLHKDSFNYLNKVQSLNRIKNINKLRQLYTSLDSPGRRKTINDANELYQIDEENFRSTAKKSAVHKSSTGLHGEYDTLRTPGTFKQTKMRLKSSIGGSRKTMNGLLNNTAGRGRSIDQQVSGV